MFRSARNTVMWVGKAAVFLIGLAVIAVVMLGVGSTAFAGNGDPFKLGQKNTASKLTTLVGNVAAEAAFLIRNPGGGPALDLRVESGQPPMVVNSGVQVPNLNVAALNGRSAAGFVSSDIRKLESPVDAGSQLGDGTFTASKSCDFGDILLSGGPANINPTSTLLESFPSGGGGTNSWTVRINKNGKADNYNVVILCANQ